MNTNKTQVDNESQRRQGRIIFLLMVIFFVTPVIVVIAMYKLNWKPAGQSNGDLFVPAKKIINSEQLNSTNQTNNPVAKTDVLWKDKWSMVYVADTCEKSCVDSLHMMRQIHVSLYKDIPRMQRVLITNTTKLDEVKARFPDLIIVNQPDNNLNGLFDQFNVAQEQSKTANRIYLVDPLGYLVVSYRPNTNGKDILKDITRLMKYAWAG